LDDTLSETPKTDAGEAGRQAPEGKLPILGSLSLVLWTLFIVTTVKYVMFAMRVDNDGEGGILALMALLGVKKQQRPTIV
jgi:KUP system potassium uptake protein